MTPVLQFSADLVFSHKSLDFRNGNGNSYMEMGIVTERGMGMGTDVHGNWRAVTAHLYSVVNHSVSHSRNVPHCVLHKKQVAQLWQ